MAQLPTAAKAERLLNLVIALVNTRQFRSAGWIRRNVAGYADAPNHEAFSRMFERDKTELRELNVPLETDGDDGYRIPPHEFSLPELTFTPEETAAVGLAARLWATTSLASAGEQALRKLRDATDPDATDPDATGPDATDRNANGSADGPGLSARGLLLQPRVRTADPAFGPLRAAALARRQVRFGYRKSATDEPESRKVQPWGLVSFRGRWYVIGYDLDRQQQRTFRLSRIVGDVTASGRAGAYLPPAELDLMEEVRRSAEQPVERSAQVRVRPGRAVGLRRGAALISAATGDTGAEGFDVLRIPIAGLWATAREIAACGADVQVLEPADLRDAVIRLLQGSLALAGDRR
ncbi:helix-turn-helix transcriptional regulator [Nakamurella lactea]|uniref:helix-turn-helix transcriptional regulator n=1 Tax=Nakamurella lactea TaxID=459515 RepID=UPI0003F944A2|nr:WYL domain-containing protein [Nakamurella lactea]